MELRITKNGSNGIVGITYSALSALSVAKKIIQGQQYLITDRADEGIMVVGSTSTTVTESATGNFLNADYSTVGDYSGVAGFNSQLGRWNSLLTPIIGDVVIDKNLHYVNLTGVVGTLPSGDVVNWLALALTRTHGYIPNSDKIIYDLPNDNITNREDVKGNSVSGATWVFPWGDPSKIKIKLVAVNDLIDLRNSPSYFYECNLSDSNVIITGGDNCIITALNMPSNGNFGGSLLDLTNCKGEIDHMYLSNRCTVVAPLSNIGLIMNFEVSLPVTINVDPAATLIGRVCKEGYSNFSVTKTMNQSLNYVILSYTTLVGGPPAVNDVVTNGTGALGIVAAIQTGKVLVYVSSGVSDKFATGNSLSFAGSGATASCTSALICSAFTYNTLVGGTFAVGDTIRDATTTNTGKCEFDNGVNYIGLAGITGPINPTDSISNGAGVSAIIQSSAYVTVDFSDVNYAGYVKVVPDFSIVPTETLGNIFDSSTEFPVTVNSSLQMGFADISVTGGNIHLPSSVTSNVVIILPSIDIIQFNSTAPSGHVYYLNKVNY